MSDTSLVKREHIEELVSIINSLSDSKNVLEAKINSLQYQKILESNVKVIQDSIHKLEISFNGNCCQEDCCQTCESEYCQSTYCQSTYCQSTYCQSCQGCQTCQGCQSWSCQSCQTCQNCQDCQSCQRRLYY